MFAYINTQVTRLDDPILNEVLITKSPPAEFLKNKIIALPKKGDMSSFDNYRGITLMSCTAKLFNCVILSRIRNPVEKLLRPNQNGFRPSRSTLEPILAIRRLIEKVSAKKDLALCSVFVEFKTAFNSVSRERLFFILSAYGIQDPLITAIKCLYDGSTSFVSTADGDSEPFLVTTGVLQGDTLAPLLFIIILDYVLRMSMEPTLGIQTRPRQSRRQPARMLTDLDFANDLALLANTVVNAQKLLSSLEEAAAEVELLINQKKTKYMCICADSAPETSVRVRKGEIDQVDDFCYLGSNVRNSERDMKVRKALTWTAADEMWRIWKSPVITRQLKIRLFKATVEPVILYGSQCLLLTAEQNKFLDGTYTRLLRKVTDTHYSEHVTNETLYRRLPRISDILLERRLRFAGHCVRRKDQLVSNLILWQPVGTFVRGGHARMTFPRRLLNDTGMNNITELHHSMLDRDD